MCRSSASGKHLVTFSLTLVRPLSYSSQSHVQRSSTDATSTIVGTFGRR